MDWMSIVADDDTDDREKRYSDFDLEYGSKKLKRSVDAATLQLPDRHTHPPLETWLVTRISEEPYSAHLYVLSFRTTEEKVSIASYSPYDAATFLLDDAATHPLEDAITDIPECPDLLGQPYENFIRRYLERKRQRGVMDSHEENTPRYQFSIHENRRFGLPITVASPKGQATIMACPDTGSDINVISRDVAELLGLRIDCDQRWTREFMIGNGAIIESIGRAVANCSFGRESHLHYSASIECIFYVFRKLASPMLMGIDFLNSTKTMTEGRARLVTRPVRRLGPLRLRNIGARSLYLEGQMSTKYARVAIDSGSELDLMSLDYAKFRRFRIEANTEEVMLADGSITYTVGIVRATLNIGGSNYRPRLFQEKIFHVLDGLTKLVILGEDSIGEFEIFTKRSNVLKEQTTAEVMSLERFIHVGHVTSRLLQLRQDTDERIERFMRRFQKKDNSVRPQTPEDDLATFTERFNAQAQRESERREDEDNYIQGLPLGERRAAQEKEDRRREEYERLRKLTWQAYSGLQGANTQSS